MTKTVPSNDILKRTYEETGSLEESGKRFNVSGTTFRRWLIGANIQLNPQSLSKKLRVRVRPTNEELISLYKKHGSISSMKTVLDVSSVTLSSWLREAGIDTRKGYESPKSVKYYGEDHYNWKGGIARKDGYVLIYCPDHADAKIYKGYIPEHRLVMEKHLMRHLGKNEVVHHKNGDRSDNRIENLVVLCRSVHIRDHKKSVKRNTKGQFLRKE